MCAYWRIPEAYLDPMIRKAISTFARIDNIQEGLKRLQSDLASEAWFAKYRHLLEKTQIDLGYRLVIKELA